MSAETFKLTNTAARLCYRTALQSIDGRSGRVRSNFELQIAPILQKFAANSGFEKRPYTAIMLAAIFAQLGLYDLALAHLDDWIRRSEGSSTEEKWLKVRALNIALYLSEYWVRKDGANASIVLRDFHIQRQKQVLALVDDLFDLRSVVRQFRHPVSLPDFSNTAFSRPPRKQTTALARI